MKTVVLFIMPNKKVMLSSAFVSGKSIKQLFYYDTVNCAAFERGNVTIQAQ